MVMGFNVPYYFCIGHYLRTKNQGREGDFSDCQVVTMREVINHCFGLSCRQSE